MVAISGRNRRGLGLGGDASDHRVARSTGPPLESIKKGKAASSERSKLMRTSIALTGQSITLRREGEPRRLSTVIRPGDKQG